MRILWFSVGLTAILLGALGTILPVLPTTPFVILAALAFGKSSPRLHMALLNNPVFGPTIKDWEAHGVITPRIKWVACTMMALVFCVSLYLRAPVLVLIVQAVGMGLGASYVLTRPSAPK